MVRNQYPDARTREFADDFLQILNGERVDAREWFVEQDEVGLQRQGTGNFQPAPLAAGQRVGLAAAHGLQAHLDEQLFEPIALLFRSKRQSLKYGQQILLAGQLPEDGRFLRQVADSAARP